MTDRERTAGRVPNGDIRRPMSGLTGKPAIPFRLRDTGGRIHLLEDYRGGWLLMVFHRHLG